MEQRGSRCHKRSAVGRASDAAHRADPGASHGFCCHTRLPQVAAKILIVENEDSNRTLMENILGLAGYRCISACNGQEALDVFEHERPDIVLTDISMPVMDGLEEVAAIRARPDGARVPIVAVTAHAMSGDREFALREGCTEYLAKPFRPRELLAVVERLLKEASK